MSEWLDFGFRIATYAACLATWILLLIAQLRKAFKEARSKNTEKVMNINKEKQKKKKRSWNLWQYFYAISAGHR